MKPKGVLCRGTLVLLLVLGLSCSGSPRLQASGGPRSLETEPSELVFDGVGQLLQVRAVVRDGWGRQLHTAEVQWTVDDPAIAAFARETLVQSLAPGETMVRVGVEGTDLVGEIPLRVKPAANRLVFQTQPGDIVAGEEFDPVVSVAVVDPLGTVVGAFQGEIELTLVGGGAGSGLLGDRTVSAVKGTASFTGLTVQVAGEGLKLRAEVSGLAQILSEPFKVEAGPVGSLQFEEASMDAVWGEPFDIVGILKDEFGNPSNGDGRIFELSIVNPKGDAILLGASKASARGGRVEWTGLSIETTAEEPEEASCMAGFLYELKAREENGQLEGALEVRLRIPFVSVVGTYCGLNKAGWAYCWREWIQWDDFMDLPSHLPNRGRLVALGEGGRCYGTFSGTTECSVDWPGDNSFTLDLKGEVPIWFLYDTALMESGRVLRWGEPREKAEGPVPFTSEVENPFQSKVVKIVEHPKYLFGGHWLSITAAGEGFPDYRLWGLPKGRLILDASGGAMIARHEGGQELYTWELQSGVWRSVQPPHGKVFVKTFARCFQAEDHTVYCHGDRPGDGSEWSEELVLVNHPEGRSYIDGTADERSICLLDDAGMIYCWGDDRRLGHGVDVYRSALPLPIACDGYR